MVSFSAINEGIKLIKRHGSALREANKILERNGYPAYYLGEFGFNIDYGMRQPPAFKWYPPFRFEPRAIYVWYYPDDGPQQAISINLDTESLDFPNVPGLINSGPQSVSDAVGGNNPAITGRDFIEENRDAAANDSTDS